MRKSEGVSVMKDKEIKLVEIETSLTLGGSGEGRVPPNTRKVIKSLYFLLKKWSVDPPTRSLSESVVFWSKFSAQLDGCLYNERSRRL